MPYPSGLTLVQWAKEATPGTDLPATSQMLVTAFNATPKDEYYRPGVLRGLMQRNRGFETPIKRWTEWSAEGPFSFEQGQNWLGAVIAVVAAPTGVGPYVWTHTKNPAVIPSLATFTLERRVTDGSTPYQHAWHYCVVTKFTLNFADGEPVTFKAEGFARRVQTETLTAALTLPTPEFAPLGVGKLWIDSTWGTLGTTVVATQILNGSIEINTGAFPIWTLDQRSDLDFSTIGYNAEQAAVNVQLTALVGAQFALEKTAAEAGTLRALRLQLDGTSSRKLLLDLLAKHEMASIFEFGEQDGQHVVEMNLQESTDGTNLLVAALTNNVATYA
jgi:hypothetical protein